VLSSYVDGMESKKSRTIPELRMETLVVVAPPTILGKVIWLCSPRPRTKRGHKKINRINIDAISLCDLRFLA
jgi:hypothetical protein